MIQKSKSDSVNESKKNNYGNKKETKLNDMDEVI